MAELVAGSPVTSIVKSRKPWIDARMLVLGSLFLVVYNLESPEQELVPLEMGQISPPQLM